MPSRSSCCGITHVPTEMWRGRVKVATGPVHFRGTSAAIPDMLANRTPLMRDVPMAAEAGLADFAMFGEAIRADA